MSDGETPSHDGCERSSAKSVAFDASVTSRISIKAVTRSITSANSIGVCRGRGQLCSTGARSEPMGYETMATLAPACTGRRELRHRAAASRS